MKNLQNQIADILAIHNLELKELWLQYSPIYRSEGNQKDLHKVNNFLRIQLGLLDIDTTEARECLTEDDTIQNWLANFQYYIAPIISLYGLPIWNRGN